MKKIVIVCLVAIVAVSSAFAFKFNSVGIETGYGYGQGLMFAADMDIIDNLDVYARIGTNGMFTFGIGAQYQVTDFKIDSTQCFFRPGAQMNFSFREHVFVFSFLATAQIAFNAGHLSAFLRPGVGLGLYNMHYSGHSETDVEFAWTIETGVRYLF